VPTWFGALRPAGNQAIAAALQPAVALNGTRQAALQPLLRQAAPPSADLLDAKQITHARQFYTAQPGLYSKKIIAQLREALGLDPAGGVDDDLVLGVAKFQSEQGTDKPGLKVDGMAGPRTLPRIFRAGLNVKATGKAFGKQAQKEVIDAWQTLPTPEARRDKLVELLNTRLAANQVPPVTPAFDKNPVDQGSLDPEFWQMQIGKQLVASAALSQKQAQNLVETVWHEGRHAEQWFRMAQFRAAQGLSARGISAELNLEATVAGKAKNQPLALGSMEAVIAQGWWESVAGSGSAHREAVLTEVDCAAALKKIVQEKAKANPTPANLAALERAKQRFDKAFAAYQDLPEENDAFATEHAAGEGVSSGTSGTPGLILRPAGKACGLNIPAETPPAPGPVAPLPKGTSAHSILPEANLP
jgi:hypothetical protein